MKKTQVQRNLSLRCKIKAEYVELCIIENSTGAIQYECIPINFDIKQPKDNVKDDNPKTELEDNSVEEEEVFDNDESLSGGNK